jgi:hypothetical protein
MAHKPVLRQQGRPTAPARKPIRQSCILKILIKTIQVIVFDQAESALHLRSKPNFFLVPEVLRGIAEKVIRWYLMQQLKRHGLEINCVVLL